MMKVFALVLLLFVSVLANPVDNNGKQLYPFKPHPLPCACEIIRVVSETTKGEVVNATQIMSIHKDYFKAVVLQDGEQLYNLLIRADMTKKEQGELYERCFVLTAAEDRCRDSYASPEELADTLDMFLAMFTSLNYTFEKKEEATFQGKKCICYSNETEEKVKMYVDGDGYIIGAQGDYPDVKFFFTVDYKFEAPLSVFVLNKGFTAKCADEAYVAPTKQLCPSSKRF